MFVDASAVTAIIAGEEERGRFVEKLAAAPVAMTSAVAIWEASIAVARLFDWEMDSALGAVRDYLRSVDVVVAPIGEAEAALALEAHQRFGTGRHRAKLNMGDCFSYACARVHGVPLLFKGEDFALTEIEAA